MAANRNFSRVPFLFAVTVALASTVAGQARGGDEVTVCQVLSAPGGYSGKMIKVRVEVVEPRRVQIVDPSDPSCGRVPLVFPDNPDVSPKAGFKLVEDKNFAELRSSLGLLLPPPPNSSRPVSRIFAVLEGRFDSVFALNKGRAIRKRKHLGYLGADENLLVLRQVLSIEIRAVNGSALNHEAEHAVPGAPAKPK